MTRFRDLPIRRKLALTTLATTAAALVLASGGFLAWDVVQFRAMVWQDLQAHAAILAENSGAPLTFEDERLGAEVLGTLRVRPRIERACLYDDTRGIAFGSYHRKQDLACPAAAPNRSTFGWRGLAVVAPVTVEGQRIGTLYVSRDLADLYGRLQVGLATVLGLLLAATAAAFLTGSGMQRLIASPLLDLADTARTISATRDYSIRATPASADEIGVVMHAFNDMLDRVGEALERERRANRLKDEFLATLSHELRTPLNAVLGWTRMLRSGRLDPSAQAQALETIERNGRAQAMLINDLLDMSRIVSGKPRLQFQNADLAEIVDAAIDVLRPAASAKRLQLNVEIPQRPAFTHGDPSRLQQVVWNLVSNAVKFTPPDGQVWISLEQQNGYRLLVRDSGPGIDRGFLPFVFDPFRQADGSTTRGYGGLGLGLAIAQQLVELHGGTIEARSPGRGGGATFEVRLPSVVSLPDAEVTRIGSLTPSPAAPSDGALLLGLKVLVVDDDADTRALLETALTQYGAHVTTASSAADAMAAIEQHPPDVLLSDIGMPGEDGYALIRQLRERRSVTGTDIPAVAVTAYASTSDALAAKAAGFQAHVAKPFDPAEIAKLVAILGWHSDSHR